MVFLQKLAPEIKQSEAALQDNIPIGQGHVQVQALLARVPSIVEGELVEVFELDCVSKFMFQGG